MTITNYLCISLLLVSALGYTLRLEILVTLSTVALTSSYAYVYTTGDPSEVIILLKSNPYSSRTKLTTGY